MASPARILCLNLGTQTIGLAEFLRADGGGLSLQNYRLNEILSDPAAESARLPQTRLAVSELKDALKIKSGAPIFYAISGQNLFARFVKLPTIAEEKVEQIIGFEAQQNVPFPIDEVVWDYQLVGSGGPKHDTNPQVDVVLVAIKADLLDELNDTVESAGYRTSIVDAAPMALYNAFRYSYADLTGCSLLIDLGARTTNLIFIEPGKVFSRSITIGGNSITQALAKEFGEPFTAAEARKKEKGYIGLGGAYAEDSNPDTARAAKVIRNTMTRLHSDISRSINFYRAQQGGSQPQRIFLCGGTANLPYTREFFGEKFSLPIEFFNPLRNVAVASRVPLEQAGHQAHQMGELVGLALRGVSHCPMELNLRPSSVVRAQKLRSRRPFLAAAALCFLLALAGWWLYLARSAAVKEQVLGNKDNPAPGSLYAKVNQLQGFEKKNNALKTELVTLATRAAPLTGAVDERQFWARVISELNSRLPKKFVWITLLEPTSNDKPLEFGDPSRPVTGSMVSANAAAAAAPPTPSGRPGGPASTAPARPAIDALHIKGLYLANPSKDGVVVDFVNELAKSPLFDVDLKNINATLINRAPPNDKEWAYEYELNLRLKPGARLPL
ncbi:MAG: type IV pilus assembly protein PilM [Verrucomicrobia bacterium]|nr:type IV pilus assembly protein PilM [Verrucomicrobiota bacterium]